MYANFAVIQPLFRYLHMHKDSIASDYYECCVYELNIKTCFGNFPIFWEDRDDRTPLFALCTASDGKLGGCLGTKLLFQHSMWTRILLTDDHKKQSLSIFFAAGVCLPYVATTCAKLCEICDHYLTESLCSNYWKHKLWDLGPKNGLRKNFLASNLPGEHAPRPP